MHCLFYSCAMNRGMHFNLSFVIPASCGRLRRWWGSQVVHYGTEQRSNAHLVPCLSRHWVCCGIVTSGKFQRHTGLTGRIAGSSGRGNVVYMHHLQQEFMIELLYMMQSQQMPLLFVSRSAGVQKLIMHSSHHHAQQWHEVSNPPVTVLVEPEVPCFIPGHDSTSVAQIMPCLCIPAACTGLCSTAYIAAGQGK
jgi:hypothetical protein